MKTYAVVLGMLCAPLSVMANDWDQVTQVDAIGVYFDRQSVQTVDQTHRTAEFVFVLKSPQTVAENGEILTLDYFRFSHSYNCEKPAQSELMGLSAGLASETRTHTVTDPIAQSRSPEFDLLRWDLVCGQSFVSHRPTFTGSLAQLVKRASRPAPPPLLRKEQEWSVARHTSGNLDLINWSSVKKISKTQYGLEIYNLKGTEADVYTVYSGEINCPAQTYVLQNSHVFNRQTQAQVGFLRFDLMKDKEKWTVPLADDTNPITRSLRSVCSGAVVSQFKASAADIIAEKSALDRQTVLNPSLNKALKDSQRFVPFEFQNE